MEIWKISTFVFAFISYVYSHLASDYQNVYKNIQHFAKKIKIISPLSFSLDILFLQ